MAEQRITTKPTVDVLLENDYIFIDHDGALRRVRKSDADIASGADLEDMAERLEQFEESVSGQIDAYAIINTANGSIVSFSDGADNVPMKSLKVAITPKQAGSGDPSPSNVRAITGWTDADVKRTGANILKTDKILGWNNVQIVDGTVTATRTDTRSWNPVLQAYKDNTFVRNLGTGIQSPFAFTKDDTFNRLMFGHSGATADIKCQIELNDIPNGDYYFSWEMISSTGTFSWHNMMISTTATAYEPYTGHTTPVPLGQTVYGGEVDVATGVLTITHVLDLYDGSEDWYLVGSIAYTYGKSVRSKTGTAQDGWCSIAKTLRNLTSGYGVLFGNENHAFYFPNATTQWGVSSVAEIKTYIASHNAQIAYPIATPTTVQLTPAEVRTLLGTNNVWSDAGDVEVSYTADPKIYIDNKFAELQALILENN